LEGKAQIQPAGAGRWSITAKLTGLCPRVLLLSQSAVGIHLVSMASSPTLPAKYGSLIKACKNQRD